MRNFDKKARRIVAFAMGISIAGSASYATTYTASTDEVALAAAVLASGTGITIVGGSETYQGGTTQGGTFTDFSVSNGTDTVSIDDGIVLTSGDIGDIKGNDSSLISANPGVGTDADLQSLTLQTVTGDANFLEFDFTVDAGVTSVSLDFVFASDEFPDQTVTDIFGVFVDGTNFAKFGDGSLISFDLGSPAAGSFLDNDFGSADPFLDTDGVALEYDGIVNILSLDGILGAGVAGVHTIKIAIGDTADTAYDSGVFVANLSGGQDTGGGGIDLPPVPIPASLPLLLAALGGIGLLRRKKR